ncbi:hypothetical protein Daesc_009822 [Daldinia eschscholtzii]|uniref:Uncharacterized protein n=1 Tax=Daldinia eschscholtzii TaxID=292717 RepID=A0AAX6M6E9_9PEZI
MVQVVMMDFQPAGQVQQQSPYDAPYFPAQEQVDPSAQLLMISDWTRNLAARLQDLQDQLKFTIFSVDPRSVKWLDFHAFLAGQFELLTSGIGLHHTWLAHLQGMQQKQIQQQDRQFQQQLHEHGPQQPYVDRADSSIAPAHLVSQTQLEVINEEHEPVPAKTKSDVEHDVT